MTTYDFWRANNEGRPIAEYLKWLGREWAQFKEDTRKGFPSLYLMIVAGSMRYTHFDLWRSTKARGEIWGI